MALRTVRARRRSDRSDSVADDADVCPDDVDAHDSTDDEDDETSSTLRTRRFLSLHRRVVKSTAFFARLAATQARWLACRRLRLSSPAGSLGRPIGLERARDRGHREEEKEQEKHCVSPQITQTRTHT
mmetsp:Transcript_103727/g.178684  ORF Transcript_103727/g.178684 Transcript_103727/m.178684 type:complete len:128 (-) Transcript_103727:32-415(-)